MSRPKRKIKVTLTVQVEADDASITDAVRQVVVDGVRITLDPNTAPDVELVSADPLADRLALEPLETVARQQIESDLARKYEEFQATGKEPCFDGIQWAAHRKAVWDFLKEGAKEGYKVAVGELVKAGMKQAGLTAE